MTPKTVEEMLIIEKGIIGVGSGGTIRFVEDLVQVEAEMKKEVRIAMAQHSGGAAINGYAAAHDELSEGSTTEEESETARITRVSRKIGATSQPVAIPRPAQESPPVVARHMGSPGSSTDSFNSSSIPPEDTDAQTELTDPPAPASVAPPPTDEDDVPPPAAAAVEEERSRSASRARAASGISEAALLESALVKRVVEKHGWKVGDYETIRIEKGCFLLPGFVDTHTVSSIQSTLAKHRLTVAVIVSTLVKSPTQVLGNNTNSLIGSTTSPSLAKRSSKISIMLIGPIRLLYSDCSIVGRLQLATMRRCI